MAIDRETIRHLERLARIELTDAEAERLTGQLASILALVDELQSVDTAGIAPTGLMGLSTSDGMRDDVVIPGILRDVALSQSPDHSKEFFRVPRVLGKGDA